MRSNFNDPLKVVDGVVHASGPIEWDPGESKAIITVILNQNDKIVGAASSKILDVSEKKWKLNVPSALSDKKFKKGWVRASAEICAISGGDGSVGDPFQWAQSVALE